MAKVFRGWIKIPAEEMPNYIQTLVEREEEFQPLRRQLKQLNGEFKVFLGRYFTPKTVRKHSRVINLFIDFLEWHTDVTKIEEIPRDMANRYFQKWYQSENGDLQESELEITIKKFFWFLDEKKRITNEAVGKSFKR